MVIAKDNAEAERIAALAFNQWRSSLAKLWRDNGTDLTRFPKDYEEAKARGLTLEGLTAEVQAALAAQAKGIDSQIHPCSARSLTAAL